MFGTYTHARPDGRVFYVGKGTEKRAFSLTPDKRRCNSGLLGVEGRVKQNEFDSFNSPN